MDAEHDTNTKRSYRKNDAADEATGDNDQRIPEVTRATKEMQGNQKMEGNDRKRKCSQE